MSLDYFIKMNMQNAPKAAVEKYYIRKADATSKPRFTVMGYEFTLNKRPDSFGTTEGPSPVNNFRNAYLAPKGHIVISRDFSGQELRIIANLSLEPTWVNTFLSGGDLHKQTAIDLYGEENYSSEKRSQVKSINFGLAYGMTEFTLAERLGLSVDEAKEQIDQYYRNYPRVHKMFEDFARDADKQRYVSNFYGRRRKFNSWRQRDQFGNLTNEGRRQSYNFPIQSLGADITITGLIKVIRGIILDDYYKQYTTWLGTVHDEINITCQEDKVLEVAKLMGDLMEHKLGNLPVPIISGLALGNSWGLIWDFEIKDNGLVPIYDELEEE